MQKDLNFTSQCHQIAQNSSKLRSQHPQNSSQITQPTHIHEWNKKSFSTSSQSTNPGMECRSISLTFARIFNARSPQATKIVCYHIFIIIIIILIIFIPIIFYYCCTYSHKTTSTITKEYTKTRIVKNGNWAMWEIYCNFN